MNRAGYLGARGIKFNIWPGSSLLKKPGKWVMAAELVDTTACMRAAWRRSSPSGWKKWAAIC
jgi:ATP-dependent helicase HrpA